MKRFIPFLILGLLISVICISVVGGNYVYKAVIFITNKSGNHKLILDLGDNGRVDSVTRTRIAITDSNGPSWKVKDKAPARPADMKEEILKLKSYKDLYDLGLVLDSSKVSYRRHCDYSNRGVPIFFADPYDTTLINHHFWMRTNSPDTYINDFISIGKGGQGYSWEDTVQSRDSHINPYYSESDNVSDTQDVRVKVELSRVDSTVDRFGIPHYSFTKVKDVCYLELYEPYHGQICDYIGTTLQFKYDTNIVRYIYLTCKLKKMAKKNKKILEQAGFHVEWIESSEFGGYWDLVASLPPSSKLIVSYVYFPLQDWMDSQSGCYETPRTIEAARRVNGIMGFGLSAWEIKHMQIQERYKNMENENFSKLGHIYGGNLSHIDDIDSIASIYITENNRFFTHFGKEVYKKFQSDSSFNATISKVIFVATIAEAVLSFGTTVYLSALEAELMSSMSLAARNAAKILSSEGLLRGAFEGDELAALKSGFAGGKLPSGGFEFMDVAPGSGAVGSGTRMLNLPATPESVHWIEAQEVGITQQDFCRSISLSNQSIVEGGAPQRMIVTIGPHGESNLGRMKVFPFIQTAEGMPITRLEQITNMLPNGAEVSTGDVNGIHIYLEPTPESIHWLNHLPTSLQIPNNDLFNLATRIVDQGTGRIEFFLTRGEGEILIPTIRDVPFDFFQLRPITYTASSTRMEEDELINLLPDPRNRFSLDRLETDNPYVNETQIATAYALADAEKIPSGATLFDENRNISPFHEIKNLNDVKLFELPGNRFSLDWLNHLPNRVFFKRDWDMAIDVVNENSRNSLYRDNLLIVKSTENSNLLRIYKIKNGPNINSASANADPSYMAIRALPYRYPEGTEVITREGQDIILLPRNNTSVRFVNDFFEENKELKLVINDESKQILNSYNPSSDQGRLAIYFRKSLLLNANNEMSQTIELVVGKTPFDPYSSPSRISNFFGKIGRKIFGPPENKVLPQVPLPPSAVEIPCPEGYYRTIYVLQPNVKSIEYISKIVPKNSQLYRNAMECFRMNENIILSINKQGKILGVTNVVDPMNFNKIIYSPRGVDQPINPVIAHKVDVEPTTSLRPHAPTHEVVTEQQPPVHTSTPSATLSEPPAQITPPQESAPASQTTVSSNLPKGIKQLPTKNNIISYEINARGSIDKGEVQNFVKDIKFKNQYDNSYFNKLVNEGKKFTITAINDGNFSILPDGIEQLPTEGNVTTYKINPSIENKDDINRFSSNIRFESGHRDIFNRLLLEKKDFTITTTNDGKFTVLNPSDQLPKTLITSPQGSAPASQSPVRTSTPLVTSIKPPAQSQSSQLKIATSQQTSCEPPAYIQQVKLPKGITPKYDDMNNIIGYDINFRKITDPDKFDNFIKQHVKFEHGNTKLYNKALEAKENCTILSIPNKKFIVFQEGQSFILPQNELPDFVTEEHAKGTVVYKINPLYIPQKNMYNFGVQLNFDESQMQRFMSIGNGEIPFYVRANFGEPFTIVDPIASTSTVPPLSPSQESGMVTQSIAGETQVNPTNPQVKTFRVSQEELPTFISAEHTEEMEIYKINPKYTSQSTIDNFMRKLNMNDVQLRRIIKFSLGEECFYVRAKFGEPFTIVDPIYPNPINPPYQGRAAASQPPVSSNLPNGFKQLPTKNDIISYEINASGSLDKAATKRFVDKYFHFERGQRQIFDRLVEEKKDFIIKTTKPKGQFTVIEFALLQDKLPEFVTAEHIGPMEFYKINPCKAKQGPLEAFAKNLKLDKQQIKRVLEFGKGRKYFYIQSDMLGNFTVTDPAILVPIDQIPTNVLDEIKFGLGEKPELYSPSPPKNSARYNYTPTNETEQERLFLPPTQESLTWVKNLKGKGTKTIDFATNSVNQQKNFYIRLIDDNQKYIVAYGWDEVTSLKKLSPSNFEWTNYPRGTKGYNGSGCMALVDK